MCAGPLWKFFPFLAFFAEEDSTGCVFNILLCSVVQTPSSAVASGGDPTGESSGVACRHGQASDVRKITMSRGRIMKSYREFEIESWEGNNQFEHRPVRSWSQAWSEMLQSVQLTENAGCTMLYTECDMICFLIYPLRIAASTLQQCQQTRTV